MNRSSPTARMHAAIRYSWFVFIVSLAPSLAHGGVASPETHNSGGLTAPKPQAGSIALPANQDSTPVYHEYQVDEPVTAHWGKKVVYPAELKAKKIAGVVVLHFVVDSTGHIEAGTVRAIRTTNQAFTAAVMAILPSGHLTPAVRGEKRVRQVVEQAFLFSPPRQ